MSSSSRKSRQYRLISIIISTMVASVCLLLMGISVFFHLTQHETNWCQMTYMYNYPQYIRIPMDKSIEKTFRNYNLYVYGEGFHAEKLKKSVFAGIPVLFIPGNAGSYRQVRSVASMSLTKVDTGQHPISFNFFTIDFDEELAGLYGGFLWKQTEFTAICVRKILSLYKSQQNSPKTVILIGHSMGGLIARGVFLLPNFKPDWANTVITLATPHVTPVIKFDAQLLEFYQAIDQYWAAEMSTDYSHLRNVTLVSIGGGNRDLLVSSDLTRLSYLPYSDKNLGKKMKSPQYWVENLAPSIPTVWASTDHLCIVWCNQLIRVLTRILFDLHEWYPNAPTRVKLSKTVINQPAIFHPDRRFQVVQYHLTNNHTGVKSIQSSLYKAETQLGSSRQIEYFNASQLQVYFTSRRPLPTVIYKKFITDEMVDKTLLLLSNQDSDAFVHRCNPDIGCNSLLPLQNSLVLPPDTKVVRLLITKAHVGDTLAAVAFFHQHRRFVLYRLLESYRHEFEIDLRDQNWHYRATLMGDWTLANFTLINFNRPYHSYRVRLKPYSCSGLTVNEAITALHYHNPADNTRDLFLSVRHPYNDTDSLLLQYEQTHNQANPILSVYLNPACEYYIIEINAEWTSGLSQIVQRYYQLFPMMVVYLIIMQIFYISAAPLKYSSFPYLLLWQSVTFMIPIRTYFQSDSSEESDYVTSIIVSMIVFGIFFFGHIFTGLVELLLLLISALIRRGATRISSRKIADVTGPNGGKKQSNSTKFFYQLTMWLCPLLYFVSFQSIGYLTCRYVSLAALLPFWLYAMAAELEFRTGDQWGQKFRYLVTLVRFEPAVLHLYIWLLLLISPTLIVWLKQLRFTTALASDPSTIPAVLSTGLAILPLPIRYLRYRFLFLLPLAIYTVISGDQMTNLTSVISVAIGLEMNLVTTLNLSLFNTDEFQKRSPGIVSGKLGRKSKLN